MIAGIYEWVRNLSIYLILVTVVLNVLPENSYKKYVKFFSGMLLVFLLMSPIVNILGADGKLDFSYAASRYEQKVREIQSQSRYIEKEQSQKLIKANEEDIKAQVAAILKKHSLYAVSISVEINDDVESADFGSLLGIAATASFTPKEERPLVEEIVIGGESKDADTVAVIQEIADFYHISEGQININIQR